MAHLLGFGRASVHDGHLDRRAVRQAGGLGGDLLHQLARGRQHQRLRHRLRPRHLVALELRRHRHRRRRRVPTACRACRRGVPIHPNTLSAAAGARLRLIRAQLPELVRWSVCRWSRTIALQGKERTVCVEHAEDGEQEAKRLAGSRDSHRHYVAAAEHQRPHLMSG